MLDMSAAFDVVNHSLLFDKLKLYGFDRNALCWMSSYLTGRSQSVCIDGFMSQAIGISTGVPQGSILGPLCYIIFTNDMPEVIYRCENHLGSMSVFETHCNECDSVCSFADDSTLSVKGQDPDALSRKLTEQYTCVADYLSSNKLKLNEEKTQLMLMTTETNRRRNSLYFQW